MLVVDPTIAARCPGMQMGILAVQAVQPPYDAMAAHRAEERALQRIAETYGQRERDGLRQLPPIDAYSSYYKQFGANYHLLGQLESVLQGKPLRAPTPVLRLLFLTELEHMLLTAGHDLRQVRLPLTLCAATGQEAYTTLSGKEVVCAAGDAILCDGTPIARMARQMIVIERAI